MIHHHHSNSVEHVSKGNVMFCLTSSAVNKRPLVTMSRGSTHSLAFGWIALGPLKFFSLKITCFEKMLWKPLKGRQNWRRGT